jgi:hypothetical protein
MASRSIPRAVGRVLRKKQHSTIYTVDGGDAVTVPIRN